MVEGTDKRMMNDDISREDLGDYGKDMGTTLLNRYTVSRNNAVLTATILHECTQCLHGFICNLPSNVNTDPPCHIV